MVKNSSTEMRSKALDLLNSASEEELKIVKGLTTKKFEAIKANRPFTTWYDAVSESDRIMYLLFEINNNLLVRHVKQKTLIWVDRYYIISCT